MLHRLVRVLACALVLLVCVGRADAFLSFLSPSKLPPPVVGHLASRVGVPQAWCGPTRCGAPRFQRFIRATDAVDAKTSTALVTATDSHMLAALNPRDGGLVWRRPLDRPIHSVFGHEDHAVVCAGPDGTHVSIVQARLGALVHAVQLGARAPSAVDVAFYPVPGANDFVVVAGGNVTRLIRGHVDWTWMPDAPVTLQRVVLSADHIYVLALTQSGRVRPRIYTLSRRGALLATHDVPHDVSGALIALPWSPRPHFPPTRYATTDGGPHFAFVGTDGAVHAVALHSPAAPARLKARAGAFAHLIDVGLGDRGYFVAVRRDATAEVLQVDERGSLISAWQFEEPAHDAVYDGSFDRAGDAFVSRVAFTRAQQLLALNFLWADARVGPDRGQVSGMSFQYDHDMHGDVIAAPFEAIRQGPHTLATRIVIVTASGSVQLYHNGEQKWRLEQGLAETTHTALVDLPDRTLGPAAVSARFAHAPAPVLEHEGLVRRVVRHVSTTRRELPALAAAAAAALREFALARISSLLDVRRTFRRLPPAAGAAAVTNDSVLDAPVRVASNESALALFHDHFGFRKVVVASTARGRLYGIDQSLDASAMLWERSIAGFGAGEGAPAPRVDVRAIVQTRPTGTIDHVPLPPRVAVVAQVTMPGERTSTRLYEFNPLTGETDNGDGVELVAGDASVHLLPSGPGALTPRGEALASPTQPSTPIYLAARTPGGLSGFVADAAHVNATWHLALAPTEDVVAEIDQPRDPVASVGRVRADRSVLYKWLNPHARLVLTHDRATHTGHAYVLDVVSGEVVHHVALPHMVADHGLMGTFAENWITLHYATNATAEGSEAQPPAPPIANAIPSLSWQDDRGAGKTRRLVSIELFAQPVHNASLTSFGRGDAHGAVVPRPRPVAYMRSFLLPYGVRALGTSRTALGVATRTLVIATDRENVVVIPRRMLDPLAPAAAAPTEIPDDLAWHVSQRELRVLGLAALTAAPSLLESTSMVLATGVDWFYTSVAPSGQFDRLQASFNKTQLVLTIAVLLAAIALTQPLMRARAVARRW